MKQKNTNHLALVLASMIAGGGLALLYVFAHPIVVNVNGQTKCSFTLPDTFLIPAPS